MKTLILTITTIILIILASYAAVSYKSDPYTLKTYVIDGNKENVETSYYNAKDNIKSYHKNIKTFVGSNKKDIKTSHYNTKVDIKSHYNNIKTFVIDHKPSGKAMLFYTYKQTQSARKRNIIYNQRDEEISKCINKITKNWKRTYTKTSYEKEWGKIDTIHSDKEGWITTNEFHEKPKDFYGYDSDQDWNLKWGLKNKAWDGKKLCEP